MAKKKGAAEPSNKFNPTEAQRETVKLCKAFDIKNELICRLILDKKGEPICEKTLRETFKSELQQAKAHMLEKAFNIYAKGLKSKLFATQLECANKIIQLCGRGVKESHFELDTSKSPEEQLNQVSKALADNLISNYQADSFVNIIKTKIDSDKAVSSSAVINFSVDAETLSMLQKAVVK